VWRILGLGATIFSRVIDNLPMSLRGQVLSRSIVEERHVLRQRELYLS
jgi:hypothetical protein